MWFKKNVLWFLELWRHRKKNLNLTNYLSSFFMWKNQKICKKTNENETLATSNKVCIAFWTWFCVKISPNHCICGNLCNLCFFLIFFFHGFASLVSKSDHILCVCQTQSSVFNQGDEPLSSFEPLQEPYHRILHVSLLLVLYVCVSQQQASNNSSAGTSVCLLSFLSFLLLAAGTAEIVWAKGDLLGRSSPGRE